MQKDAIALIDRGPITASHVAVPELLEFAAGGLPQMLHPNNLFCYTLRRTETGMQREGVSHRYSLMTVLGLYRYMSAGSTSPIDTKRVVDAILKDRSWIVYGGDFGLLLWTLAVVAPERLEELLDGTEVKGILARHPDTQMASTMELAWFLAGVAHCHLAGFKRMGELLDEAKIAFELLKRNCGPSGIFGHLSADRNLIGRVRGRIGSFADQVYPIYALAKYGHALHNAEALHMAVRTGQAICDRQGPQGEWWWHYDAGSGRAVGRYPVYSVHQHAMGPMALFALSEAVQEDFTKPVLFGLDWIYGRNALKLDMHDRESKVIWRSLYQSKPRNYSNQLLAMAGLRGSDGGLQVKYECRPYELGWLLYAFSGFSN